MCLDIGITVDFTDLWKLRFLTRTQNHIYFSSMNFHLLRKKSFGIDLGNTNTLVSDHEKLLIDQPSYIVLDKTRNGVKAVGNDAYNMFEKTHHLLKPVKPLKGGVIADYESASKMLCALMDQAYSTKSILDGYEHIISGVPYDTTNVERRALRTALEQFNARTISLIYEPLAAAIGMGLNIQEPDGKMVVDIGGGITEMVVISLSGIASFKSITVSGDTMDEDIQRHFYKKYNMAIGLRTAEQIKINLGAASENIPEPPAPMMVKGKDMLMGIPIIRETDHIEIAMVLDRSVSAIELGIIQTLEQCPPELAGDIFSNGIFITGGNALLRGLKERLEQKIKVRVNIDPNALLSVSKGVATVLQNPKKYKSVLLQ
jgi:rod shape-determining protein MreB